MTRKTTLIFILLFFLAGLVGEIAIALNIDFLYRNWLTQYGILAAKLLAIMLMLAYGSLLNSKIKYVFGISAIVFLIGVWAKILHLPLADILILIGCYSMIVIYAVFFFTKKQKLVSDYLKLVWVGVQFGAAPLFLMKLIGIEALVAADFTFLFLFVVYMWEQWKLDKLQEEEEI